jgi:hypothetical protein
MSKYRKGQSGNPGGRPKGTLNKSTKEIKDLLAEMVDFERLVEKLEDLSKRGNVRAIELLFAYRWGRPTQSQELVQRFDGAISSRDEEERLCKAAERALESLIRSEQTSTRVFDNGER